jgi:sialate O-acetylesterase
MKIIWKSILLCAFTFLTLTAHAQWNNKQCAVVLPALESLGLTGTFYLIGASPVVNKRMDEWRAAAKKGNELGNHSLYHPCDGSLPGRSFVTADHDLSKYTVYRAVSEVEANNTLLKAIDGKIIRTFAYPCGDLKAGDQYFYYKLKGEFAGARGVTPGLQSLNEVDLTNVRCYAINGQSAEYMINLVKQAMQTHTLLVFLFHGVGGGHNINVGLQDHSKLLHYLKANEDKIWIAPMVDVAEYINKNQPK